MVHQETLKNTENHASFFLKLPQPKWRGMGTNLLKNWYFPFSALAFPIFGRSFAA